MIKSQKDEIRELIARLQIRESNKRAVESLTDFARNKILERALLESRLRFTTKEASC